MPLFAPHAAPHAAPSAHAYHYLNYTETNAEIQKLAAEFPSLARAWTTQRRYGLPSVGICAGAPCETWVLEVTERASLGRSPERPDVLVSGALHGDEIVGPLVTLELGRWLLRRQAAGDAWARRLVRTRRLLLLPLTNAVGFAQRTRRELQHDPNRDFPYQPSSPSACMTTVAARSVNELLRAHLLQLVITFHAGMQALAYVWGDFAHRGGAAHNRCPTTPRCRRWRRRRDATPAAGCRAARPARRRRRPRRVPAGPDERRGVPGARRHGGLGVRGVVGRAAADAVPPAHARRLCGRAHRNLRERDRARGGVSGRDIRREAAIRLPGRPAHALRAGAAGDGHVPRTCGFPRDDRPGAALCGDHWAHAPADAARGGGG